MAETHTLAKRRQWASKSPEEKSAIMSKVARAKHAKLSEEERMENAIKLVKARAQKKQNG